MSLAVERFWAKVERRGPDECWPWLAGTDRGWGVFGRKRDGRWVKDYAHRIAYELAHGRPPVDTIDHLCRNRACVNPAHLEDVPQGENARRACAAITHCPAGHEYTPANTYTDKNRCRHCRACKRVAP